MLISFVVVSLDDVKALWLIEDGVHCAMYIYLYIAGNLKCTSNNLKIFKKEVIHSRFRYNSVWNCTYHFCLLVYRLHTWCFNTFRLRFFCPSVYGLNTWYFTTFRSESRFEGQHPRRNCQYTRWYAGEAHDKHQKSVYSVQCMDNGGRHLPDVISKLYLKKLYMCTIIMKQI